MLTILNEFLYMVIIYECIILCLWSYILHLGYSSDVFVFFSF